jgi:hypothetical protein
MLLKFGEKAIEAALEQLDPAVSKRSGKELERIRFEYMIRGEDSNAEFLELLSQAKESGVVAIDPSGNVFKRFDITNNSYIYSGNSISTDTIFTHIIELSEEDIKVEALLISGKEFTPYVYDEENKEDALFIRFKIKLNDEQLHHLKEIMNGDKYFPVIRRGLSEEPLMMRFVETKWSKHPEGVKYLITLVERTYDRNNPCFSQESDQLEMVNLQKMLAMNNCIMEGLIELLAKRELLKEQEIEDLKRDADKKVEDMLLEFHRIEDIDG